MHAARPESVGNGEVISLQITVQSYQSYRTRGHRCDDNFRD